MTTDIIELSKQAAEVLGVPASVKIAGSSSCIKDLYSDIWLAEDAGRCAEIAADKRISTIQCEEDDGKVRAFWYDHRGDWRYKDEHLADHNNERIKAYCVAVCKAILEQAKQS